MKCLTDEAMNLACLSPIHQDEAAIGELAEVSLPAPLHET